MVMSYSHAEVEGQRSVGSEDRVETNGQTNRGDCIASHANAIGNKLAKIRCGGTFIPILLLSLIDFIVNNFQNRSVLSRVACVNSSRPYKN